MSFDIFYQPCRYGKERVVLDPFTRTEKKMASSEPLSKDELGAVEALFKKVKASKEDDSGFRQIEFGDGGSVEIQGENLKTGCMVSTRAITPKVLGFLFDLLKAGNWAMLPAMEDARAIACSATAFSKLPKSFPAQVICKSPEELGIILEKGIGAWEKYRDRVVGKKD